MDLLAQIWQVPLTEPGLLKYAVQFFGAAFAVWASSILLGAKHGKLIIFNSIVGGLSWDIYAVLIDQGNTSFSSTLMAAIAVGIAGQVGARVFRLPVSMIIIPSLYPLVPGALLYRAANAFVNEEAVAASQAAVDAFIIAMGIALGLILVETIPILFRNIRQFNAQEHGENGEVSCPDEDGYLPFDE